MEKSKVKDILMSMRTAENEYKINNLLGKIDLLPDEKLQSMIQEIGDSEESVRNYLKSKISPVPERQEHTPINKMFSYGISGNSIHLHMPVDLNGMIRNVGNSRTMDIVNLNLLDAIEKIRQMQKDGYSKFAGKDCIYMISPILIGRELKFLEGLDFQIKLYSKKELQDKEFVSKNPESQLATHIFGNKKNVGTAIISLEKVNSKEWQEKRLKQVKEFEEKGITLTEKQEISEEDVTL